MCSLSLLKAAVESKWGSPIPDSRTFVSSVLQYPLSLNSLSPWHCNREKEEQHDSTRMALTALQKDLDSRPSSTWSLTTTCNSSSRGSDPSKGTTGMYTHVININIKNSSRVKIMFIIAKRYTFQPELLFLNSQDRNAYNEKENVGTHL